MKNLKTITLVLMSVLLMITFFSCGKSGSDTSDIYIPDINGSWINQANANDQFSFLNAPSNAATGSFTGSENISGSAIAQISGSFTHSKVSFTVTFNDNSVAPVTYSGTVSGTTNPIMSLSSSKGKLVLKKQ